MRQRYMTVDIFIYNYSDFICAGCNSNDKLKLHLRKLKAYTYLLTYSLTYLGLHTKLFIYFICLQFAKPQRS